jgi:hypothetical protein
MRGVVKGKRWLLLTRWMNLDSQKRQQLNELFALLLLTSGSRLKTQHASRILSRRCEKASLVACAPFRMSY